MSMILVLIGLAGVLAYLAIAVATAWGLDRFAEVRESDAAIGSTALLWPLVLPLAAIYWTCRGVGALGRHLKET